MTPEQIAELIDDHRNSEGEYDAREIQGAIVDSYTDEERESRDWQAARRELERYEKANKPSHDPQLFEPRAVVVLGDNRRIVHEYIKPTDAQRRMQLVIKNANDSLTAANRELTYYQHFIDSGWESGGLGKFIEQTS